MTFEDDATVCSTMLDAKWTIMVSIDKIGLFANCLHAKYTIRSMHTTYLRTFLLTIQSVCHCCWHHQQNTVTKQEWVWWVRWRRLFQAATNITSNIKLTIAHKKANYQVTNEQRNSRTYCNGIHIIIITIARVFEGEWSSCGSITSRAKEEA